jgi:cathepsin L
VGHISQKKEYKMSRYRNNTMVLLACLLSGAFCAVAQAQVNYAERERKASPQIKAKLDSLRKEIKTKNWHFQVNYTEAADHNLKDLTGLKVPSNLPARIQAQQKLTAGLQEKPLSGVSASLTAFDWRTHNGVTDVKDQNPCGACWDFAAVSAFEASWRLINRDVIDASEQDVLDNNEAGDDCSGGWPADALAYLKKNGCATEKDYLYKAAKKPPKNNVARPYKVQAWGYVGGPLEDTSNRNLVNTLKQKLLLWGPLAVCVYADEAFQHYGSDTFDEFASGDINHCVTLIGWDDNKQAWLIKNSWGKVWGDQGYMWIAYGCNHIGADAVWVSAQPESQSVTDADFTVTIYKDSNFSGKSVKFIVGQGRCYKLVPQLGSSAYKFNDQISSVKVGKKVGVLLYQHDNYAGKFLDCVMDISDLAKDKGWNDVTSSLIVFLRDSGSPVGVVLSSSHNQQFFPVDELGNAMVYTKVAYNDDAESVNFDVTKPSDPSWGTRIVTVYKDANLKGISQTFQADARGSQFKLDKNLSHNVSSLKIELNGTPLKR